MPSPARSPAARASSRRCSPRCSRPGSSASGLPVDGWGTARTIVVIVLVPVVLGLLVRLLLPRLVQRVLPVMPWFSVLVICLVVAIVVSLSADRLVEAGLLVTAAVILHNLLGLSVSLSS